MTTAMNQDALPEIAGYTVERLLGVGGMARVYQAIQHGFERKVALKVVLPELASNPEFGRRFLREARIVGGLSHPHIVSVYDVREYQGCFYLAMELFTAGDLRDRIRSPLGERKALQITQQIASALGFAHNKGFIHRDIKPDNVLFRESGEAVVTDFGIARPVQGESELTEITQVESVIGSPKYMSPEQSMGRVLDGRSDIYSLGVLLYQMLVGQLPFEGRTAAELSLQRLQKQIPQLPTHLKHLQPLMDGMLAYECENRYANCHELLKVLNNMLAQAPAGSHSLAADPDAQTLISDSESTGKSATTTGAGRRILSVPALVLALCLMSGIFWLAWSATAGRESQVFERDESAVTPANTSPIPMEPATLYTPAPREFFAFYDSVNSGVIDQQKAFIDRFPNSVFTDLLRVKMGDDAGLYDRLRRLADSGSARAQLVVSELLDTGWGGQSSQQNALDYARKAAEAGNPFANYHYATLILKGANSDAERRVGLKSLEQSAEEGFYLAQTVLANYWLEGQLLGRNVDEGLALLNAAAEQGDRNALFNLARILDAGLYQVRKDPERARGYFETAAELGHSDARNYLDEP